MVISADRVLLKTSIGRYFTYPKKIMPFTVNLGPVRIRYLGGKLQYAHRARQVELLDPEMFEISGAEVITDPDVISKLECSIFTQREMIPGRRLSFGTCIFETDKANDQECFINIGGSALVEYLSSGHKPSIAEGVIFDDTAIFLYTYERPLMKTITSIAKRYGDKYDFFYDLAESDNTNQEFEDMEKHTEWQEVLDFYNGNSGNRNYIYMYVPSS